MATVVKAIETLATPPARRGGVKVPFSVAFCGLGTLLFSAIAYVLCSASSIISDPELYAKYEKVDHSVYAFPCVAFATAFALNLQTLLFERQSSKFNLALMCCYINLLAGINDYLSWKGYTPVVRDAFGNGFQLLRPTMWAFTTPAMVYLLSLISDMPRNKVFFAMFVDVIMVGLGISMYMSPSLPVAGVAFFFAFGCFLFILHTLWSMYNLSIQEAKKPVDKLTLEILRTYTVGFWISFPIISFLVIFGFITDINTEEFWWCIADFLGKVVFCSSLVQGNFLTMDQRKFIAMRIVEESNRIQVIKELQDLVEQKESFMSSMSHELRTPLNGIIGLSDALLTVSCGDISDQVRKTITTIKTSGSRLLNLINDILDAASMKKGKLVVKQEAVNLKHVVDDVVELTQPLAKRGVKIINDIGDGLPIILGDTGRIIQIFHNLVGNSCKFSHQGHISISAVVKGGEVEVSVADTGIGIPEEKFGQIFDAFEQVDMSTTRKYGGTGLGLNLVKQLVEAHGGTINVKSKQGVGTTFFFTLKIHPDHGKTRGQQARSSHSQAVQDDAAKGSHGKARRVPSRRGSFSSLANKNIHTSGSFAQQHAALAAQTMPSNALRRSSAKSEETDDMHVNTLDMPGRSGQMAAAAVEDAAATAARRKSVTAGPQVSGPMSLTEAATMAQGAVMQARRAGAPPRVLSVDDDQVNQTVVKGLLTNSGFEVVQANSGAEALRMLARADSLPDVVLLDVMMPGMSGYEVCRKLREMHPNAAIPVIMVSAKSKEEHIVKGFAAGGNDYMTKPFGRQEMVARIRSHLKTREGMGHSEDGSDAARMGSTEGLQSAMAGLQGEVAALKRGKAAVEAQLEEVSKEVERLQEENDALTSKMRKETASATAIAESAAKYTARIEELDKQVVSLTGQLAAAQSDLVLARSAAQGVQAEAIAAKAQVSLLSQQLESAQKEMQALTGARAEADTRLADSLRERSALESTAKELSIKLQGAEQSLAARAQEDSWKAMQDAQGSNYGSTDTGLATMQALMSKNRRRSTGLATPGPPMPPPAAYNSNSGRPATATSAYPPQGGQQAQPDIRAILTEVGLSGLISRFEAEDISLALLPYLDDEALKELGVTSVGARTKLKSAVQWMRG